MPRLVVTTQGAISIRSFTGTDPEYERLDYLGSGTFGSVTKVRKKANGRVYACKAIDVSSNTEMLIQAIAGEVLVLSSLGGCRNVVQWHNDISVNPSRKMIHLHMDYYSDGDLKHRIDKHAAMGETFTHEFIMGILGDLLNALEDCHAKDIVHRDIKPANILLSGNRAYLADFGLGKFSSGAGGSIGTLGTTGRGTPAFMAPENFGPRPLYGPKTDVFALGGVLYQLCELRLAFRTVDKSAPAPPMTSAHAPALKALVRDCLALDPRDRPNTAAVRARYRQVRSPPPPPPPPPPYTAADLLGGSDAGFWEQFFAR